MDATTRSRDELRGGLWERERARYDDKLHQVGREVLRLPDDVQAQLIGADALPAVSAAPAPERDDLAGRAIIEPIERNIMLQIVDAQWKDHLYSLDHLKDGIGLRGYGQRDPLVEYKKESFALFQDMRERVDDEMLRYLWRLRPVIGDGGAPAVPVRAPQRRPSQLTTNQSARSAAPAATVAARAAAAAMGGGPAPRPSGRRRRRHQDRPARRAQGRPQRPLPLRERQEVQEVSWGVRSVLS